MEQGVGLQNTLTLLQPLEEGGRLFRALSQGAHGNHPVLVRLYPAPTIEISRKLADADYRSSIALENPSLLAPTGLHSTGTTAGVVLEDFSGVPLSVLSSEMIRADPESLLYRIAQALGEVHDQGWSHLGLFPHSVLAYGKEGDWEVRLSGCAYAQSEEESLTLPLVYHLPQEDWRYVSPELYESRKPLTHLDLRLCDLYSLGALYSLLLENLKNNVPYPKLEPFYQITSKLLSHDPGKRYRSLSGILRDLETLKGSIGAPQGLGTDRVKPEGSYNRGAAPPFPFAPGLTDPLPYVSITFWGRETEKVQILDWIQMEMDKAGGGLVEGEAGSGKTLLVKETLKGLREESWLVLEGKFSEEAVGGYTGFASTLELFVKKVHLQPPTEYDRVKAILEELPAHVLSPLCSWVPTLSTLFPGRDFSPLAQIPTLDLDESQRSLQAGTGAFLELLCRNWKGIVLFLDDLQWAQEGALELIRYLLDLHIPRLFLLCTARPRFAPFGTLPRITLLNFSYLEVQRLLYISFPGLDAPSIDKLTSLSYDQTSGNPLFLRRLLEELYRRQFLRFRVQTGKWVFEEPLRLHWPQTRDVSHFLTSVFRSLDPQERRMLEICSCFSDRIYSDALALAGEFSKEDLSSILLVLKQKGFLDQVEGTFYRFSHDKFQEIASSLMDEEEKQRMHLTLARALLKTSLPRFEGPQEPAEQFTRCLSLLDSEEERLVVGELELEASRKMKAIGDITAAWSFLDAALRIKKESDWEHRYPYALRLHTEGMDLAFLLHKTEEQNALSREILKRGRSFLDILPVYEMQIEENMAQYKLREAAGLCIETLSKLGLFLEPVSTLRAFLSSISFLVKGKKDKDRSEAVPRVLSRGFIPLYLTEGKRFPRIIQRATSFCWKRKDSPYDPLILIFRGITEAIHRRRIRKGYRFGEQALLRVEQPANSFVKAKVYFLFYFLLFHWKHSLREVYPNLLQGFEWGLVGGDWQYGSMCMGVSVLSRVFFHPSLKELEEELTKDYARLYPLQENRSEFTFRRHRQVGYSFRVPQAGYPWIFAGPYFDESQEMENLRNAGDLSAYYTMQGAKLILSIYFQAVSRVEADFPEDLSWRPHLASLNPEGMLLWYQALYVLRRYAGEQREKKEKVYSFARRALKELSFRAVYCPVDYKHRVLFLKGEMYFAQGLKHKAERLYLKACKVANQNANYAEQALLEETLGRFYLGQGREAPGKEHIERARGLYAQWGAEAKVRVLDAEFSLPDASKGLPEAGLSPLTVPLEEGLPELEALMSAGRSISGEIRLEILLEKVLHLLLKYGGADYGYLEYETENQVKVAEALILSGTIKVFVWEGTKTDQGSIIIKKREPQPEDPLRQSIATFMKRRGEEVVVEDMEKDPLFSSVLTKADPVRAVFCAALVRDEAPAGYVYLKSTWISGAFTPTRIGVLKLLLAQATVSLENAVFYLARRELIEQRERLLRSEKLASLGILTATVAHEVNNPNHVIRLHAEVLKKSSVRLKALTQEANSEEALAELFVLSQQMEDAAKSISTASERISGITRELKGIVHNQEVWKEIDLNQVVQSVIRLSLEPSFSGTVPPYGSATPPVMQLDPALPLVKGDFNRLQQVVLNLLENAVHAVEPIQGSITIRTRKEGNNVLLEIQDTGEGIPEDRLPHVTEPFYTTRKEKGGTGLGLYVVTSILKDHRGRLELVSQFGKGTLARVYLPATG